MGTPNGSGYFKWVSGETYWGELYNGKIHGKGIKTWPDGKKYEGEFQEN